MSDAVSACTVDPRVGILEVGLAMWHSGRFGRYTPSTTVPADHDYVRPIPAGERRWLYVCGPPDGEDPAGPAEVLQRYRIVGGEPERWVLIDFEGEHEVPAGHPLLFVHRGEQLDVSEGLLPRWAHLARVPLTEALEQELCADLDGLATPIDDLALTRHDERGPCVAVTEAFAVGLTLNDLYNEAHQNLLDFVRPSEDMSEEERAEVTLEQGRYMIAKALDSMTRSALADLEGLPADVAAFFSHYREGKVWDAIDDDLREEDGRYAFLAFLEDYEARRDRRVRVENQAAFELGTWQVQPLFAFAERAALVDPTSESVEALTVSLAGINLNLGENAVGRQLLRQRLENDTALSRVLRCGESQLPQIPVEAVPAFLELSKAMLEVELAFGQRRRTAEEVLDALSVAFGNAALTFDIIAVSLGDDLNAAVYRSRAELPSRVATGIGVINTLLVFTELARSGVEDWQTVLESTGSLLESTGSMLELFSRLQTTGAALGIVGSYLGIMSEGLEIHEASSLNDMDRAVGHAVSATGAFASMVGSASVLLGLAVTPLIVLPMVGVLLSIVGKIIALLGADQPIETWAKHCEFGDRLGRGDGVPDWADGRAVSTWSGDCSLQLRLLYKLTAAFALQVQPVARLLLRTGQVHSRTVFHLKLDLIYMIGLRYCPTQLELRVTPSTNRFEVLSEDWHRFFDNGLKLGWRRPDGGGSYRTPYYDPEEQPLSWRTRQPESRIITDWGLLLELEDSSGGVAPDLCYVGGTIVKDLTGDGSILIPGAEGLEFVALGEDGYADPISSI